GAGGRSGERHGGGVAQPGAAAGAARAVAPGGGGDFERVVAERRRGGGRDAGRDHLDGRSDGDVSAAGAARRAAAREHRALLGAQPRAGGAGAPGEARRRGLITPPGTRESRSVLGPTGPR